MTPMFNTSYWYSPRDSNPDYIASKAIDSSVGLGKRELHARRLAPLGKHDV